VIEDARGILNPQVTQGVIDKPPPRVG